MALDFRLAVRIACMWCHCKHSSTKSLTFVEDSVVVYHVLIIVCGGCPFFAIFSSVCIYAASNFFSMFLFFKFIRDSFLFRWVDIAIQKRLV